MSTLLAVRRMRSSDYQHRVVLWNLLALLWIAAGLAALVLATMPR